MSSGAIGSKRTDIDRLSRRRIFRPNQCCGLETIYTFFFLGYHTRMLSLFQNPIDYVFKVHIRDTRNGKSSLRFHLLVLLLGIGPELGRAVRSIFHGAFAHKVYIVPDGLSRGFWLEVLGDVALDLGFCLLAYA